ncbi:MAG: phosphotransferase [Pseudomonadota bacterium]
MSPSDGLTPFPGRPTDPPPSTLGALAEATLAAWGGAEAAPRLVVDRENAVFDVVVRDGLRAALRLHRAGYRSPAAISAELRWMAALADQGFPCPTPVASDSGGWLVPAPDGRVASLVTWVDATPLSDMPQTPDQFRRLGALIARLHEETDRLAPPTRAFPSWSAEALLGDAPVWGRFWENPSLTPAEAQLLGHMRFAARARLEARAHGDHGLIHADLLSDNILDDGTRLWVIDFDDSGRGERAYDLGTALISHVEDPAYPELAAALVAGYAGRRGSVARLTQDLPLFVTLRALASCGWVKTRCAEGDPLCRAYADRALRLAERYLSRGHEEF